MALRQELLCKSETQQQRLHNRDVARIGLVSERFTLTFTFNISANSPDQGILSFGSCDEMIQVRRR
jgi:hypothetical protein